MVRIKKVWWLSLVLVLIAAGTAEAEERPTDPYTGEEITWDLNGAGEEELAGLPENQGKDPGIEDQIQDQFDVLQQMYKNESAAETDGRELTTCHLEIPDYEDYEWNQNNVTVILRGDGGLETFTLYRQSGFKTVEQLKAGRYTLVSAKTIDGSMIFKAEEPWFEVNPIGENVIALFPGEGNITAKDITISAELETINNEEKAHEKRNINVLLIIGIVIILLLNMAILAGICILIMKKRKNRFS